MKTLKNIEIAVGIIIIIAFAVLIFGKQPAIAPTKEGSTNQSTTTPSTQATSTETMNFNETGNLVNNNPSQGNTNLTLVYEKPGAPALTVKLVINEKSLCGDENRQIVCMAISRSFGNGERVQISGIRTGDMVEVRTMISK